MAHRPPRGRTLSPTAKGMCMIGGTDPNEAVALTESLAAIDTALRMLSRLGRSGDADQILTNAENARTYAGLEADTEHNDDWLRTAYARAYTAAMSNLASRLTTAADRAAVQDRDDAARVYGIKGLPGDVASLTISRRDAGDRVAAITDSPALRALLDTAVRNGDDVLAHAIAERAVGLGDSDLAGAFQAAYPQLSDAVERLWDCQHRRVSTLDVTTAWRVAALKPALLGPLQDYEIAAASGRTGVGQWNAARR
jgi:hypothetical protein